MATNCKLALVLCNGVNNYVSSAAEKYFRRL